MAGTQGPFNLQARGLDRVLRRYHGQHHGHPDPSGQPGASASGARSPARERDASHVPLALEHQSGLVPDSAYGASQERQVPPAARSKSATATLLMFAWVA